MKVSAPGKLFLLGEYAVLDGGSALLVPVEQRASVELGDVPGGVSSVTNESVTLSWPEALEKFPLLNSVKETLNTDRLNGHALTLDTSQFFLKDQKLGLGSSAALTVALVKACRPDDSPQDIYQLADICHKHFQGGVGSGADIALAAVDKPIEFSMDKGPSTVSLPSDLHMLAIWTGHAASTTALVGSMQDYRERQPRAYEQQINQLKEIASACISDLTNQDSRQILARIEQYDRQLRRLSSESGVNFYNDLHENMRKKVKLTYKPSGAGGGDFGIAYSADKEEITALARRLQQEQTYAFLLSG